MTFNLELIPEGDYCYTPEGTYVDEQGRTRMKRKLCPYWSSREDKPKQENGHCAYLNVGDWESEGFSLLWDQVKECGLKTGG